jgi:CheY-like chemotaxis protein
MAQILLVDDHADAAEVLMEILSAHGHTVIRCETAEEALTQVIEKPPSVVVADQRLPGMSGVELIRALRSRVQEANAPMCILCSADDSLMEDAREAGASDFWIKGSERFFEHVEQFAQRLTEGPATGEQLR